MYTTIQSSTIIGVTDNWTWLSSTPVDSNGQGFMFLGVTLVLNFILINWWSDSKWKLSESACLDTLADYLDWMCELRAGKEGLLQFLGVVWESSGSGSQMTPGVKRSPGLGLLPGQVHSRGVPGPRSPVPRNCSNPGRRGLNLWFNCMDKNTSTCIWAPHWSTVWTRH